MPYDISQHHLSRCDNRTNIKCQIMWQQQQFFWMTIVRILHSRDEIILGIPMGPVNGNGKELQGLKQVKFETNCHLLKNFRRLSISVPSSSWYRQYFNVWPWSCLFVCFLYRPICFDISMSVCVSVFPSVCLYLFCSVIVFASFCTYSGDQLSWAFC